ncbi:MAG: von Willebrand factor type A domain-containing protein [Victivallales bacterium]|jgi:Ca-activated chloride channel family protein
MNCNDYSILITDLLAGEISEKDKAVLDSHLAACESCKKEFEELKTVWALTENALKEDFFDDSLKPDQYQKIFNSVKPDIQPAPSKKSTPIKFMWLEIAATIAIIAFLAGLLLPALSPAGDKARRLDAGINLKQTGLALKMSSDDVLKDQAISERQAKTNLHSEKPAAVPGNWHPIDTPADVFIPKEEKLAEDESAPGRSRAAARGGKSETSLGVELQKERRKETETLGDRTAGKDASYSDRDSASKADSGKIAEKPKSAFEGNLSANGHAFGYAVPVPSPSSAGVKNKIADKSLSDDYKFAEALPAAKPAAPPMTASPVPAITTAPRRALESNLAPAAKSAWTEESAKLESTKSDFRRKADPSATEPVAGPAESKQVLAYDRIDSLKTANEETDRKKEIRKDGKEIPLTGKNYTLNLKLWDLTDEKTAREFLKRKGANFADSADISINKDSNTIRITTTKENLEKADELFSELRKAEDSLKEMKNGIPFIPTKQKPFSTFSIDVDTASYTMARKLLRNGQKPESFSVRPEEFINYFDYHYRSPANSTFAVYLESAPSVFRPEDYTLRVGVKARELGPDGSRPSVFTILIDASGSMARESRMDLVKKSLPLLLDQMKPDDKVAVIACTHRAINIVNYLPVREKRTIIKLIEGIMPAGVADIENGLVTAYDSALKNYVSGAYNRVILLTDGISNIGTHSAEKILAKVSSARNMGITNTVIALGGDGDDKFLEKIANKGDGNYVYIENEEGARELFVNEFAGRFREIARDVKIQVEFNPMIVSQYRQIGYQNRQLSKADFRNDKVDAGEVGAGQSVTALYEMKLNKAFPPKSDDAAIDNPINYSICIVRLRYRRADNMDIEEKEFPLAYHELKFNFGKASSAFRLAASVAEFAEFLRFPDVPGIANPENIMKQVQGVIGEDYRNDGKVSELYALLRNVK